MSAGCQAYSTHQDRIPVLKELQFYGRIQIISKINKQNMEHAKERIRIRKEWNGNDPVINEVDIYLGILPVLWVLVARIGVLLASSVKRPLKRDQPLEAFHLLSLRKVQGTRNRWGQGLKWDHQDLVMECGGLTTILSHTFSLTCFSLCCLSSSQVPASALPACISYMLLRNKSTSMMF